MSDTMTTIEPLSDRVLIRRTKSEGRSAGGIIIPDAAREKPVEGEVIAVGPGRYERGVLVPMTVKVGNRVLFSKYAGTEARSASAPAPDGDTLILREEDIFAIVRITLQTT